MSSWPSFSARKALRRTWHLLMLGLATALVSQVIAAPPASAGTVGVTPSIQGSGFITTVSGGPYTTCDRTANKDERVTLSCPREAFGAVFNASVTIRANPSTVPAGHWRFVGWTGCDAVSGTDCTLTSGPFTLDERAPKAIFADDIAPTITSISSATSLSAERTASFFFGSSEAGSTFFCRLGSESFTACSSGVSRTAPSEGDYNFQVIALDPSGQGSSTATQSVKFLDTAITGGPFGLSANRNPTFTFSSLAGIAFECSLDFAPYAACGSGNPGARSYTGLADGGHSFRVRARHGSWLDGVPAVRNWTIDGTAPNTSFGAVNTAVDSRSAVFNFGSSEGGSFQCALGGPSQAHGFVPCGSPRNYGSLADGSYSFQVRAVDNAGNIDASPAVHNWSIDLTAPQTTITSGPAHGGWLLATSTTLGYASSEAGSTFACKLDAAVRACGGSTLALSGLSQASHLFTVAATDPTGNADLSPASRIFTVPRNNTTLTHSSGWAKVVASGYYLNTYSQTRTKGKTLSKGVTGMRKLSLVATKGVGHGTVRVYLGSTLLKTVSLNATSLKKKQVIPIANFASARTGTVKVLVYSTNKPVRIEGLGVATR